MRLLKSLVIRNIQHAKTRRSEVLENDISNSRYWDGYISALESIVHVLPDEEEEREEILQARQSPASSDNPTTS
jgi:hypothetical protein